MKKTMLIFSLLMTSMMANNVSSSIDWSSTPPKKVSIEHFIEMEAEVLEEKSASTEAWYRHYNGADGWDYYCHNNECCYIGKDTNKEKGGFSKVCK